MMTTAILPGLINCYRSDVNKEKRREPEDRSRIRIDQLEAVGLALVDLCDACGPSAADYSRQAASLRKVAAGL